MFHFTGFLPGWQDETASTTGSASAAGSPAAFQSPQTLIQAGGGEKAKFQVSLRPEGGSDDALKSLETRDVKVLAATERRVFSKGRRRRVQLYCERRSYFCFVRSRRSRGRAPLAGGPLLLQDSVDVVHFAEPLEEGDEVQQLRVGHVIEPRGHGHLDGKRRPF